MRARGSAPQPETGTGTASRPGTQAAQTRHDERHDRNGKPAHDPDAGLDAYVRELVDAAPPLTSEQRRTLALLLNSPGPVPAQPASAAAADQRP